MTYMRGHCASSKPCKLQSLLPYPSCGGNYSRNTTPIHGRLHPLSIHIAAMRNGKLPSILFPHEQLLPGFRTQPPAAESFPLAGRGLFWHTARRFHQNALRAVGGDEYTGRASVFTVNCFDRHQVQEDRPCQPRRQNYKCAVREHGRTVGG